MHRHSTAAVLVGLTVLASGVLRAEQGDRKGTLILAASPVATSTEERKPAETRSPEEKMQRRFPQPVRVGHLIGLPILDDNDRTIGYVKSVVRTDDGKIHLIVPYGGFLGWGQRLVAVPIEVVAIAGRQLAALDMPRAEFDTAPAWDASQAQPIEANEFIRVGLYRR